MDEAIGDEGGVMNEVDLEGLGEEVINEEDEDKLGVVINEEDGDEGVGDKEEDRDEEVINEEVRNEGIRTVRDESVEVPINIKVHYNYTNEHTLYLSLMY